jgi:uncharacterized membrane protein HdeD (DUF308 family)
MKCDAVRRVTERKTEMKALGVALLVLGLVALVFGGIEFDRQRTISQISSMSATVTEHQTASPVALVAGLLLLGGGVVLLLVSQKPRRA